MFGIVSGVIEFLWVSVKLLERERRCAHESAQSPLPRDAQRASREAPRYVSERPCGFPRDFLMDACSSSLCHVPLPTKRLPGGQSCSSTTLLVSIRSALQANWQKPLFGGQCKSNELATSVE